MQLDGKSSEQYITAMHYLAETCNFRNLKEDLICDRLVVGIRDQALSQQLQMDPDLTLDKAKKRIRQKEAVRQQSDILKGKTDKPVSDLEGVRYKHKSSKKCDDQPQATIRNAHAVERHNILETNAQLKMPLVINVGRHFVTYF